VILSSSVSSSIPAELRANWVFRMSESADRHVYHRAVRKAMFLLMTLPVLLPVFAVEAILWGTDLAAAHALLNALLSWVLVGRHWQASTRFRSLVLTPGTSLPYSAGLYFAIFATYSTAMSQIGYRALTGPRWQPLIWLVVVLTALAIGFRWHRRQRPSPPTRSYSTMSRRTRHCACSSSASANSLV
jgi:hypothetical protein